MYRVLSVLPSTSGAELFQQIDDGMTLSYSGNPNGLLSSAKSGVLCYDTVNKLLYLCTTPGDASTTVWDLYPTSTSSINDIKTTITKYITTNILKLALDNKSDGLFNYVRNGTYQVWNKGASFITTALPRSPAPGWIVWRNGSQSSSVSRQITGNEYPLNYSLRATRDLSDAANEPLLLEVPIPMHLVRELVGQYVTISFNTNVSSLSSIVNKQIKLLLLAGTGPEQSYLASGFSNEAVLLEQVFVMTSSITTTRVTYLIPEVLSSTQLSQLSIIFSVNYSSLLHYSNDTFDLLDVRMTRGDNTVQLLPSNQVSIDELQSLHYYCSSFESDVLPGPNQGYLGAMSGTCTSNGSFEYFVQLPQYMRNNTYTVRLWSPEGTTSESMGRNTTLSTNVTLNVDSKSSKGFRVYKSANITDADSIIRFHYEVDGEIF